MEESLELQAEFIEDLYRKTRETGSWKPRVGDGFETSFDDLTIHLDRHEGGELPGYTVWIFSTDGLVEGIRDYDLDKLKPKIPEFDTYWKLFNEMYWSAVNYKTGGSLSDALRKLRNSGAPRK